MLWQIWDKHYKIIIIIVTIALLAIGIAYHHSITKEKPVIIANEKLKSGSVQEVAKVANVNIDQAKPLQEAIQHTYTQEPQAQFVIVASTIEKGAERVAKEINAKNEALHKSALADTDRTIVTANTDKQTVDVYKVNLAPKVIRGIDYSVEVGGNPQKGVIGYEVNRRISDEGKYIGVRTSYDIAEKKVMVGIKYMW